MDIDIDVSDNKAAREILGAIRASIVENSELKAHIVGLYFQHIPVDPLTGLAAIPYNMAEEFGYYKFDVLNLSILDNFSNKHQIRQLLKIEPNWNLLQDSEIIPKLFHLSKHAAVLNRIKPTTVEELADVLALIRPNKKHLIDKYLSNKTSTRLELYNKVDASDLRKSHAIPYALIIVLQLHLLGAGII
jgi:hypothetical protein